MTGFPLICQSGIYRKFFWTLPAGDATGTGSWFERQLQDPESRFYLLKKLPATR